MSPKESKIQVISFNELAEIRIDPLKKRVVITRKEETEKDKEEEFNRWWTEKMALPFLEGLQIWINNQGTQIGAAVDIKLESVSSEMSMSESENNLVSAFRAAKGHHFTADKVVDKMISFARSIQVSSNLQPRLVESYLEFTISLQSREWKNLSKETTSQLKARIFRKKMIGV